MAKKAVATFKKGDGRTYSKVIKMVKSPKTGAYIFQEEMIPNEAVIVSLLPSRLKRKLSRIGNEFLEAITLLIDCKRDNNAVLDTSNLMVLNY